MHKITGQALGKASRQLVVVAPPGDLRPMSQLVEGECNEDRHYNAHRACGKRRRLMSYWTAAAM